MAASDPLRAGLVYVDPLDQVWVAAARRIGFEVRRSPEVYAHYDGEGHIVVGTGDTLDPDDCMAQMVFHELCHGLVQGPDCFGKPDWGLDNTSERDYFRERATLRVQRVLASRFDLVRFLAPTTDFRGFHASLGDAPLDGPEDEIALACTALQRAEQTPFDPHLYSALRTTRSIVSLSDGFAQNARQPGSITGLD
jgi:hypothetical protein